MEDLQRKRCCQFSFLGFLQLWQTDTSDWVWAETWHWLRPVPFFNWKMTTWPHSRASQKEHKTRRPRTNDILYHIRKRTEVTYSGFPCPLFHLSVHVLAGCWACFFHLVISTFKPGVFEVWTVDFGACSYWCNIQRAAAAAMAPVSSEVKREEVFQASPWFYS